MLAVLAVDVFVFFAYNIFQPKKMLLNEKKINHQNDVICFKKICNK